MYSLPIQASFWHQVRPRAPRRRLDGARKHALRVPLLPRWSIREQEYIISFEQELPLKGSDLTVKNVYARLNLPFSSFNRSRPCPRSLSVS